MTNVFIFHGVEGTPQENWFPWLQKELEKLSDGQNGRQYRVFIPQFPTPDGQTLENWLGTFEGHADQINKDVIFIGHSLGGLFMLSLLEKFKIKMAVFVASFGELPGNKFDDGMRTFAPPVRQNFDWQKIRRNCEQFLVFHSDNDPYVMLETAQNLAKNLGVEVTVVKGAGHFNGSAGYTEFPLLLQKLRD